MYSGNHNVTSDCWWVVRVPQGQAMQLRWDSFNVHSRLEAGVCDGNYVEVVDGLNTGSVHRLIPRYYGATIPAVHTTNPPQMLFLSIMSEMQIIQVIAVLKM